MNRVFLFLIILIVFTSCKMIDSFEPSENVTVVLTFDDGDKSIYELGFPAMKKYAYPGVNFIPTGFINRQGFMTLDQVIELEKAGWETGGHTVNHANLTTIKIDSARWEIKTNYEQLVKWGLKHRCFALPAGHSNDNSTEQIKKYFEIIRTSQNERYSFPLNLDRLGYYQVQTNDDLSSLMMRVNHAIVEGECLVIFGFHQFTTGKPNFITQIKISLFEEFLRELKEKNLEVATLSDAVDQLNK